MRTADFQPSYRQTFRHIVVVLLIGLYALKPLEALAEPLECLIEPYLVVDVSSSEIGIFKEVGIEESDLVETGEVIAELHTDVELAALEYSRASAKAMSEQLTLLRQDYDFNLRKRRRFDELLQQKAVSQQDVEKVRTDEIFAGLRLRAAIETLRAAEHEVRRDELSMKRRIVRSPITGVVSKRYKTAGEYVDGDPIAQLVQLNPLRVEVVAPISMLGQIKVGMQASIAPELDVGEDLMASVDSIDPVVDAATATFGIRLTLPNPEHLIPAGLKCTLVMNMTTPPEETLANAADGRRTDTAERNAVAPGVTRSTDAPETDVTDVVTTDDVSTEIVTTDVVTTDVVTTDVVTKDVVTNETPASSEETTQFDTLSGEQAPTDPAFCASLGPLVDGTEVSIDQWLTDHNFRYQRRIAASLPKNGLWVILSDTADQSTRANAARLQSAGVQDHFLITSGPRKGRFSYGVYRDKTLAERRLAEMETKGFQAELLPHGEANSEIWLDLTSGIESRERQNALTDLLDINPTLTVRSIPCTQLANR